MKLSLNWIKDFIKLPENMELSKLVYDLTMSTVEVEEAVSLSDMFDNMVVGVVKEIRPHPDADKLVLCMVDIGATPDGVNVLREIVCGGINLSEGMKVAVARPGAKVRWHGEGDLIELKKTKVRGVESYGMICASSEIGLFDLFPYTEEGTIVDLSEFDAAPGTNLAQALGLDDTILTIDNKSLTNRPDLWGHYGMARELAAIYDLPLKNPFTQENKFSILNGSASRDVSQFSITIADPNLCPRYIGVKMENVSTKPSPFKMQTRLWSVGVRPINAIVDITNYVMLETGNPTHAFDAGAIKGGITIRPAKSGEKLTLLDGKELALTPDALVIADDTEAIALAGVMGGAKDSILPDTENAILEIANFNALTVRRTATRYDVRTEAASRYEKAIDPQRVDLALASSMRLFKEVFPDMQVTAYTDNYPQPLECKHLLVSLKWLERRLGKSLSPDYITRTLELLGFEISIKGDNMDVTVPSWRSTGDVSLPDDIMEEIARIHGLENFKPAPIVTAFDGAINQPQIDIDRKLREYLSHSCGMSEVSTYPWVNEEYNAAIFGESFSDDMLEMESPPSPAERFLRKSLLPGLCRVVAENLRFYTQFRLFESAQVFFDKDYTSTFDEREMLPKQTRHIAGAIVSGHDDYAELFRITKGILEAMPRRLHTEPFSMTQECDKPHWADNTVWQYIVTGDTDKEVIGTMGLLSQKAALACGIKNSAVMLFELNIDALRLLPSRENSYKSVPVYPMTEFDVSLLFDVKTKWDEIETTAAGKKGPDNMVQNVTFIEEYRGNKIPDGKKSVTLRLTIGSTSKTLTSDEIEACAGSVTKRLMKTLGAEKR